MHITTVEKGEDPLESLAGSILRAAMGHPGAAGIPGAPRITAGLIGLLAAEGADHSAARFLAVLPGEPTTFDVESEGGEGEADTRRELLLGPALRQASKLAQTGVRKVTVTSVSPSGLRRRVLEWAGSGSFRYVYPAEEQAEPWREWLAVPEEAAAPGPESEPELEAGGQELEEVSPEDGPVIPEGGDGADGLVDAVRAALADVSVEVDTEAIVDAVNGAVLAALAEARAAMPAPNPSPTVVATGSLSDIPGGWVAQATLMAAADELHVQLQSFSDRVRAGGRALEDLADELAQRERSAADFTEQLAKSLQSSLDRLARHIDDRLDDLAKSGL